MEINQNDRGETERINAKANNLKRMKKEAGASQGIGFHLSTWEPNPGKKASDS